MHISTRFPSTGAALLLCSLLSFTEGCSTPSLTTPTVDRDQLHIVSKWERFETVFYSSKVYENPFQDVTVRVLLTSPSGRQETVAAFWDGGRTWRMRYSPDEVGQWQYESLCSDSANQGLDSQRGGFLCSAPRLGDGFSTHGPVRISHNGRFLEHEDFTPFFWLADTAWNGALKSTESEWTEYLFTRKNQNFTAIQWVTTQWRAAPNGDINGQPAFTGKETIRVNPEFFQRLDKKADAVNAAGLLNAPVLLWAIGGGSQPEVNPGFGLPEDQAIRLARYMVARWQAHDVIWILGGDGDYLGENAERWKNIGDAVFGDSPHAPVTLHPRGMQWILPEFRQTPWLDIMAYQSGHGDSPETLGWIVKGPPSKDWQLEPHRPFINMEPPYENHVAYQSRERHTPHSVRRAIYWSLLVHPPAGITYGGHGVWGWDDGTSEPTDHSGTGLPLHWREAMQMPAANQMKYLHDFFTSIDYWKLRPHQSMLAQQPGETDIHHFITAAATPSRDLAVLYTPVSQPIQLFEKELPSNVSASWFDPRMGKRTHVTATMQGGSVRFEPPSDGDWVLLLKSQD